MLSGKPENLTSDNCATENSDVPNQPVSLTERIAFRQARKARITRSMSAPVIDLQTRVKSSFVRLLQSLFDRVDDALFDLAETASNNEQQNNFFESMREVRFKRVDMERCFLETLQDDFVELFSESRSGIDKLSARRADDLSLMNDDDVEEMVAVDAMVSRFDTLLAVPLDALNARLCHLANIEFESYEEANGSNPLSPKRLCQNFAQAGKLLNIDIKARIVIFKLFEKLVLSNLAELYKQANEQLIRAGVLENYTGRKRAPDDSFTQSAISRSSGSVIKRSSSALPEQLPGSQGRYSTEFSELLNLLNEQAGGIESLLTSNGTGLTEETSPSIAGLSSELMTSIQTLASSAGPNVGTESLVRLLNSMQHDKSLYPVLSTGSAQDHALYSPDKVLSSIHSSLLTAAGSAGYSLGRTEREVMTLVSMLFQFVLDDKGVAEPMRIVISRLQLPVIKLALQDPEFFCNNAHPARRLLNELTQATIGWVESDDYHKDSLYQTVCGVVDRVLADFEKDPQLFADLLADLKSILSGEDRRAEQRRKRLVDAEMGKDASAQARSRVDSLLADHLTADTPDFVRAMLESNWANLLFLTYVQQGEESEAWCNAVDMFKALLWTVSTERSKHDRSEILKMLPQLLKNLRDGFGSVNCDKAAQKTFFTQLEKMHMEVMQRPAPLHLADNTPQTRQDVSDSGNQFDGETAAGEVVANLENGLGSESKTDNDTLANEQTNDSMEGDLTTIVDTGADPDAVASDTVSTEFKERAAKLAVGQWIELREGGVKKRCRLVAILRNNGKRIFVDRLGAKSCEFQVDELAQFIHSGKIVLLEDAQLFDNALSSIISGLRNQKNAANL